MTPKRRKNDSSSHFGVSLGSLSGQTQKVTLESLLSLFNCLGFGALWVEMPITTRDPKLSTAGGKATASNQQDLMYRPCYKSLLSRWTIFNSGERLKGRTITHDSKKGSEKVLGRVLGKGSQTSVLWVLPAKKRVLRRVFGGRGS